jgi:hypothetical protein
VRAAASPAEKTASAEVAAAAAKPRLRLENPTVEILVTTSDALRAPTKLQLLVKVPETVIGCFIKPVNPPAKVSLSQFTQLWFFASS